MNLPTFSTEATDELCRDIAKKSHGTIFCMMSRGKDSLCAYLQCCKYFQRVIPFHCALIPGYVYATEYLDYLEAALNVRILRMMSEDLRVSLSRYAYQDTPWECAAIDEAFTGEIYSKLDVLEYLRMKFNLPRAWCAVGISKNDSIDRLIYCRKNNGRNESHRTFYPCWDWPREELLNAIGNAGLCVAPEYKYSKRSLGVPGAAYNKILMEHFPRDWETTKMWYPLAEAKNYREELIDADYRLWMEQEAGKRGGRAGELPKVGDGGEGEPDGSDGEDIAGGGEDDEKLEASGMSGE